MTLNSARFNQDGSCICVASEKGFKVLNSNPLIVTCDRDLRQHNVGGIGTAEMLYRTNLLALVGNSEYYDIRRNRTGAIFNTFIKPWRQNILTIWDDRKLTEVAQLVFGSAIVNTKLLHDLIRGTIVTQLYSEGPRKVKVGETLDSDDEFRSQDEELDVFEFSDVLAAGEQVSGFLKVTLRLHVHRSDITSVDLSPNGLLLATSSQEGSFIKLFDTLSGELIQVFRKTANFGRVVKCSIDAGMEWLAVITDRPRLYVFRIDQKAVAECEPENENRRIDFRHSCIFDINREDTDVGRYFRHYRYSIANPVGRCAEIGLCRSFVNKAFLFVHSSHHVMSFRLAPLTLRPPQRERILDCAVLTEAETIVIVLQGGRAMKLFFSPAKCSRLRVLFYHNL